MSPEELRPVREAIADRLSRQLEEEASVEGSTWDPDPEIPVRLSVLQRLVAGHTPNPTEKLASIYDPELQVTYRARIGRGDDGETWLKTVEILPDAERPDPAAFKVPVVVLAREAAYALASVTPMDTMLSRIGDKEPVKPPKRRRGDRPAPEELCELLLAHGRRGMAEEHLFVHVATVDAWLREARAARPDLPWPPKKRSGKKGVPSPNELSKEA